MDSLRVLAQLDQRIRTAPKDAAAWYHRGQVAATLAKHGRAQYFPRGLTRNELDATAAKSLRTATQLDPKNPRYLYTLAHFWSTGTFGERKQFDDALESVVKLSRTSGDTALLVDALVELGNIRWAEWWPREQSAGEPPPPVQADVRELFAPPSEREAHGPAGRMGRPDGGRMTTSAVSWDRAPTSVVLAAGKDSAGDLAKMLKSATEYVVSTVPPAAPMYPRGDDVQRQTELLFTEAFAVRPEDRRGYTRLATYYVTAGRWSDLAGVSREQVRRDPGDAWGWMALGLARQRMRMAREAQTAFDSALARFAPEERARLDRLDRVLTWYDSTQFAASDSATRARVTQRTWLFADPLWSLDEGTPRQEFLARLAYAELRWTGPTWPGGHGDSAVVVGGADTQRGDLYVRYGPPDSRRGNFWLYDSGLLFSVTGGAYAWSNGYRRPPRTQEGLEFYQATERVEDWQPSRWDNITTTRVDSMPTQVVRFRGGSDSVDVFIAAQAPLDSARSGARATARYWLLDEETLRAATDSATVGAAGEVRWTRRAPRGEYYYRAEAVTRGAAIAGRTVGRVIMSSDTTTGFTTTGFGISDPLLATRVVPSEAPRRWTDFEVTPLLGEIAPGSAVSLVWENYELGERDGSAQYTVKLTLERKWKMFLNRVRARVISAWAAMMGSEQTSDRVIFHYDRSVAHAAALADYVTLALEDTPAGNYDLSLEITDKVTGKTTSRTTRIVIRD